MRKVHRVGMLTAAAAATAVLAMLAVLASCGSDENARQRGPADGRSPDDPTVVATTTIWADVVSAVTCNHLDVHSLIPLGVDAHDFEPSVQDVDRLREANVVFANGLGLEADFRDAIAAAKADGVSIVSLAPDLDPVDGDPHVWMDPDRVAMAVPIIEAQLAKIQGLSLDSRELARCANEYTAKLNSLSKSMRADFAAISSKNRKLVTNHENLRYFADRFGFEVVGELIPSTSSLGEADPRSLDELADAMKSADVRSIFVDATGTEKLASSLAERVGREVHVERLFVESLGPSGSGEDSYLSMMATDAKRVASALGR